MYVYLVINRVEDHYVYEQLEAVCSNQQIAEREAYALRKREGYKKDSNEVAIWKKRVNKRDKVFVLKERYDLCGVDVFLYKHLSTSLKKVEGYKKHLCQMHNHSASELNAVELTVLQA